MKKEFNYRKAADYAIEKLGGKEAVKHHIIASRKHFREITLPERAERWWRRDLGSDDLERLYELILDRVKEGAPDVLAELQELRHEAGKFCDRLDNLLFYYERSVM
jgi:hypothetical protein